jgi:hypothetical protein
MYKFYKILKNGAKKCVGTFNSTLDPNYHAYINWCRENGMSWELINTSTGKIKYSS